MPPPSSLRALHNNNNTTTINSSAGIIGAAVCRISSFSYGLFSLLCTIGIAATRDGALMKKTTAEQVRELEFAQEKYWTLTRLPLPGFRHHFFTLKNGVKLHYVVNGNDEAVVTKNIAIFIHGFPDSYLLWRNHLKSPILASYVLIAVDIPGYGGSDSLQKYDAEGLLESLTAFILGMRVKYLRESGKVVIVTHDWGGILGARLASEAKELADRWIIASAVIPQQFQSNVQAHASAAKVMLHTWIRRPFSLRLLKTAFSTLLPVFGQIRRSFYIFCFNLPWPLATFFATMGNFWLLKIIHQLSAGLLGPKGFTRNFRVDEAADWLAMSSGPGIAQFTNGENDYPVSVRRRADDYGMSEKIRIYRESASLGVWEKSLEAIVALSEVPTAKRSSGAGLFEYGPPGALQVPTTIIYGKRDPAFEKSLVLGGIQDYLTKGSQVLTIEKAGHWLPHEGLGSKVIEECTEWALSGEEAPLKNQFEGLADVKFLVDK